MKNLHLLDGYRLRSGPVVALYGWEGDATCGAFRLPSPIDQRPLLCIASAGAGWDHVSVSRQNRMPNWTEMEHVKRLFFRDDETAMQLHVPTSDHVNAVANCLHLWRPQDVEIPRPPGLLVGVGDTPIIDDADRDARFAAGLRMAEQAGLALD